MSAAAKYQVSVSGVLLEGFEAPPVVEAFSELFSVSPEKAASFVGSKRVVKKDLTLEEAMVYRKNLVSIGIDVILKDMESGKIIEAANDPVNDGNSAGFDLVPNDEIPGVKAKAPKPNSFSCPKCDLEQEKSEQCTGCGVYFNKLDKLAPQTDQSTGSVPNTSSTKKTSVTAATKTAQINETADLSLGRFILPVIAAALGAIVWKLIAMTMGYEFGFVAWGIGGAVGTAAVLSGASGNTSGIACAILVVLAIFGGKYMTYSSIESDYLATLGEASSDFDLKPIYDEMKHDATVLAETPYDNASLRTYMYQHFFTDASSPNEVTDLELEDFKLYNQPELEEFHREKPAFDVWKTDYVEDLHSESENLSITSLVFESLGVLDLIFLLLGVSTAYQIGRAGKSWQ